ncbi:sulfonate ABC transporter substrate-binding protein [Amantichitinum ursilacus]|uniref:Putative aliphatic sulfonates-binding protein n=1 Tax=Amantichitinum ursilacus TaxID=857265 RepID=A0A0N0GKS5_9NEIS|nr:sulfonate ABC transporter substrate-binding protein [Amantichitinum ursilacus]KPC49314.1 putative aliphatic sulfonates-binding protein precursor [Amantichitinum ursilacus]
MLRKLFTALAPLALGLAFAAPTAAQAADQVVRVGYQKYGAFTLLKGRGTLEKKLEAQGWKVSWTEFPGGPQLLEALNVGAVDFGLTGEAPPVFAQAAGAQLVYIANEPPAPQGEAILVAKDSPIKSVKDLKGKKVALNKGSNVHYLLVKALEEAGLKYSDIQPVYLPPADARAAFSKGAVDAWVIWDPYLAAAEAQLPVRTLRDGKGLVANHQFILATRKFATAQPAVVKNVLSELQSADQWANANPAEAAKTLASQIGLPVDVVAATLPRNTLGLTPITPQVANQQQQIADVFKGLGLIPVPVKISDALLAQ